MPICSHGEARFQAFQLLRSQDTNQGRAPAQRRAPDMLVPCAAFFPHTNPHCPRCTSCQRSKQRGRVRHFPSLVSVLWGLCRRCSWSTGTHTFINRLPHNWPVYTTAARVSPDVKDANQRGRYHSSLNRSTNKANCACGCKRRKRPSQDSGNARKTSPAGVAQ